MLRIHDINTDHAFPLIRFSFENTGSNTIIPWQFSVRVLDARIDPTPQVYFWHTVDTQRTVNNQIAVAHSDSLLIRARNDGWGDAEDCELSLSHPTLNTLFSRYQRQFTGDLPSGESVTVLRLSNEHIRRTTFMDIREGIMARAAEELERSLPQYLEWNAHMTPEHGYPEDYLEQCYTDYKRERRTEFENMWHREIGPSLSRNRQTNAVVPTIPISALKMHWHCRDRELQTHRGISPVHGQSEKTELFLCAAGFIVEEHLPGAPTPPVELNYCPIIDPDEVPNTYQYPVTRTIASKSTEYFNLFLGATKSCTLKLQLSFATDQSAEVVSQPITITVWNPMHGEVGRQFRDGDELRRTINDYRYAQPAENKKQRNATLKKLRWLEDRLEDYPFIEEV